MTPFNCLAATLAMSGLLALSPSVHAQSSSSPAPVAERQAGPMTAGQSPDMGMSDTQMMAMHQQMMADMSAMDVKLDALVTKMNSATGAAKVDAMAEALTALVEQHKTMRNGMLQMQGQMMTRMHGAMAMPMGGAR